MNHITGPATDGLPCGGPELSSLVMDSCHARGIIRLARTARAAKTRQKGQSRSPRTDPEFPSIRGLAFEYGKSLSIDQVRESFAVQTSECFQVRHGGRRADVALDYVNDLAVVADEPFVDRVPASLFVESTISPVSARRAPNDRFDPQFNLPGNPLTIRLQPGSQIRSVTPGSMPPEPKRRQLPSVMRLVIEEMRNRQPERKPSRRGIHQAHIGELASEIAVGKRAINLKSQRPSPCVRIALSKAE